MCGIAGIAGEIKDKTLTSSMLEMIGHRGPDSQGFYLSDHAHLGHCRLSIVDLSEKASQPFISVNDEVIVLVNGEIYNFKSLKKNLMEGGYQFKSESDCEVVLHGYLDSGLDYIGKLNGMFAIVLLDNRKGQLMLIRDRLGIKPLYYSQIGDTFLFASELKALACCNELSLSIDYQSFSEYLTFGNYFSNRTLNREIKIVQPSEIVKFEIEKRRIRRRKFWKPVFNYRDFESGSDIYSEYRNITEASIKRHLLSDVPIGFYLSSGIDSSSVVSYAADHSEQPLKTYTGYFGIPGFYDESEAAKKTADTYFCKNTRVVIKPNDFVDHIENILWHLDEPIVGMGSFSQYMVAKRAARDVKVMLTGHGGDELFAGYPVFKAIFGKKHFIKLLFNSSFRELLYFLYFTFYPKFVKEAGYFFPSIFSEKNFPKLLELDFYRKYIKNRDILSELKKMETECNDDYQRLTLTYIKFFLPALFIVEDKISMAFSLESRTPLCDNEMLDFALSLPLETKLHGYELKHVPRNAMRQILPESIFRLPKRGFPTPLRRWFKGEIKSYIRNYILDHHHYMDMFNFKYIEKILDGFQNSKINTPFDEISAYRIWILLNLAVYFKNQRQRYC